jgi:hypothetical protein
VWQGVRLGNRGALLAGRGGRSGHYRACCCRAGRARLVHHAWGKAQARPATPSCASPGAHTTGPGRARVGPKLRASCRAVVSRAAWIFIVGSMGEWHGRAWPVRAAGASMGVATRAGIRTLVLPNAISSGPKEV